MEEIWLPITNYETKYEVSNYGRVKSLGREVRSRCGHRTKLCMILKNRKLRNGYYTVTLPVWKTTLVHRLVAIAFIPNPDNKRCVNHIDFNKENNNVDNLEWVTHKENSQHSIDRLRKSFLRGEKCKRTVFTKEMTGDIFEQRKRGVKYSELERIYGIKANTICGLCTRNYKNYI